MKSLGLIGGGLYFEDLELGTSWRSAGRTLLEPDLATYINLTWFTEDLFTDLHNSGSNAIGGRPVPAVLVMAFAEGLIASTLRRTGLAFLNVDMNVLAPTRVGDTIHVDCEVIEAKVTSKGDRGLVRTRNTVINQDGTATLEYSPLRLLKLRSALTPAS